MVAYFRQYHWNLIITMKVDLIVNPEDYFQEHLEGTQIY